MGSNFNFLIMLAPRSEFSGHFVPDQVNNGLELFKHQCEVNYYDNNKYRNR